jgi:potassium/hydrogen antiporter
MSTALILGLVGGLLVLAFLANRLSRLTRIPDVLMLMALGVVLGPGLHLLHPADLTTATNLLGTLAIILVLFEGGLELKLRDTLQHFPGGFLLAILGYGLSVGLVALIVHKGLGLPLGSALAVGAVLGCTSSTVVLPVLQQLNASEAVRVTLMLEASWGDGLAVLTVGLLVGRESPHGALGATVLKGLANPVGLAVLFVVATGVLWSRLLPVLSEARFWQVITFSILLLLCAGMEALEANGLIAVLAFGLTLANFPGVDPRIRYSPLETYVEESQQALLTFHSELAFLVRTFFFVLIGTIAELGIFRHHPLLMLGTLATVFVARLDSSARQSVVLAGDWAGGPRPDSVDHAPRLDHHCACLAGRSRPQGRTGFSAGPDGRAHPADEFHGRGGESARQPLRPPCGLGRNRATCGRRLSGHHGGAIGRCRGVPALRYRRPVPPWLGNVFRDAGSCTPACFSCSPWRLCRCDIRSIPRSGA